MGEIYHYKTIAAFNTDLSSGAIVDSDLCFIKDEAKIWTHGKLYGGLTEEQISLVEQIKIIDEVSSKAINDIANSLGFEENLIYNPTNPSLQGLNVTEAIDAKQDTLQSGTNIKTINGETILGSGDITIEVGGGVGKIDPNSDGTGIRFGNDVHAIGSYSRASGNTVYAWGDHSFVDGTGDKTPSEQSGYPKVYPDSTLE